MMAENEEPCKGCDAMLGTIVQFSLVLINLCKYVRRDAGVVTGYGFGFDSVEMSLKA